MSDQSLRSKIQDRIYSFFVDSHDFNGMPLRNVSQELSIDYKLSIDIIKELVAKEIVSIQSSTNPHIIYSQHYPIDVQLRILDEAKNITQSIDNIAGIQIVRENTEYPICVYPSPRYLFLLRNPNEFGNAEYSKLLGLGEPQLSPRFFEIDVLERYLNDPRFDFQFQDYSGRISYNCDDNGNTLVRPEDEVFLKSFGLGFDKQGNRLAVVYLRYLKDLTPEHQIYWKSKEVM